MKDRIYSLIQQFGPMLPVEVASRANMDSFMAKAYLAELIADGKIRASKEKIADSHLYYTPSQEAKISERLSQIKTFSQKTARTYAKDDVNVTPEVRAKRDAFAQRLMEIEKAETQRKHQKPTTKQNPQPSFRLPPPKPLPISKPTFTPQPKIESFKPTPKPSTPNFIDQAMDWLRSEGIEIVDELGAKKTEMELMVKVHTDFGRTSFYIKIKQKKTVTEADLLAVYASAMEHKCPGVLITNGKLAKSAESFLEEKSGIVKVKQL